MAIHGHGGSTAVAVTKGASDAWAHCQYASAACSNNHTMVGAHTPALCSLLGRFFAGKKKSTLCPLRCMLRMVCYSYCGAATLLWTKICGMIGGSFGGGLVLEGWMVQPH